MDQGQTFVGGEKGEMMDVFCFSPAQEGKGIASAVFTVLLSHIMSCDEYFAFMTARKKEEETAKQ